MSTVRLEAVAKADAVAEIPMQPASWDIWDKKYRLKTKQGDDVDADIDGTAENISLLFSGSSDEFEPFTLNGSIVSFSARRQLR